MLQVKSSSKFSSGPRVALTSLVPEPRANALLHVVMEAACVGPTSSWWATDH